MMCVPYRKVSNASIEEGLVVYPPPPVATGPGLDRPLQAPLPEYVESPGPYTMMRTARFYQVFTRVHTAPSLLKTKQKFRSKLFPLEIKDVS